MSISVIEGAWDDIVARHGAELTGRHVRLTVEQRDSEDHGSAALCTHFYHTASKDEFERAFDAIAAGSENLPVLPPEAFERESLYDEAL